MGALDFKQITDIRKRKQSAPDSYNLINADRELSKEEIEAEEKAEKFSLKGFGRIYPNPGTLGYFFRNLRGGNEAVIEHLRNAASSNKTKFLHNFILIWNNLDSFSRRRVDIFDIICRKYSIDRAKFWGIFQEGCFKYNDAISQVAISNHKNEFVELLKRKMAGEKNSADRKLYAEIAGMIDSKPLISIEDNSQNLTVNNNGNSQLPSFAQSISRAEQGIKKGLPQVEPRRLTEGQQDYIDAEIILEERRDKELVEVNRTPEEELIEAAKEL